MLRELKKYLAISQPVDLIYLDRHGQTSKRTVRLLSVGELMLRAYCLSRHGYRVFKIENILAVCPAARVKRGA